jgi:hypothetical protein
MAEESAPQSSRPQQWRARSASKAYAEVVAYNPPPSPYLYQSKAELDREFSKMNQDKEWLSAGAKNRIFTGIMSFGFGFVIGSSGVILHTLFLKHPQKWVGIGKRIRMAGVPFGFIFGAGSMFRG